MWRSKKLIIVAVIAAVVLVGSIGGVVLANGDGGPAAKFGDFIDRVCDIYDANIDPDINRDVLKAAIAQAQDEMQAAAMEARLAKMVENGVIDGTQAQELQEWWESRPDVPVVPGLGGHGMHRGFGGPGGFGGWFGPPPPE